MSHQEKVPSKYSPFRATVVAIIRFRNRTNNVTHHVLL